MYYHINKVYQKSFENQNVFLLNAVAGIILKSVLTCLNKQ